MKPEKTLLIGLISYNPAVDIGVVDALNGSLFPMVQSGWQWAHVTRSGEADLGHTRNGFFTETYAGPFSDLLTVDGDVAWEPGAIQRMLAHPVDLVMAPYPRRDDSGAFSLVPKGPLTRESMIDPVTGKPDPENGLLDVLSCPLGFARISRTCIERMVAAYPDLWYRDPTVSTGKCFSFFEFVVRNHEREREDYHFCRLWREIGGTVWVDPHMRMTHAGRKAFTGRLADKLRVHETGAVPIDFLKTLGLDQ